MKIIFLKIEIHNLYLDIFLKIFRALIIQSKSVW